MYIYYCDKVFILNEKLYSDLEIVTFSTIFSNNAEKLGNIVGQRDEKLYTIPIALSCTWLHLHSLAPYFTHLYIYHNSVCSHS